MRWFLILIFASSPCFSEPSFTEKHVDPFVQRTFDRTSLTILAVGVTSVLMTNTADNNMRSQWMGYQKMSKETAYTGDLLGSGGPGVLIVGAQYFFDDQSDHWNSHARALAWGAVTTFSLKIALNRQRPGNSSSRQSLPSGHTATAFTTATSLTYAYGWKAAVIAYPVAVFVGASRLSADVHWSSDVVAGAFLGYVMGRASDYSTSAIGSSETVVPKQSVVFPVLDPDQPGLGWVYLY